MNAHSMLCSNELVHNLTKQVSTIKSSKMLEVFTYLGREERMLNQNEECLPSGAYKKVIVEGAIEHELPAEYIGMLMQIKDNGYIGQVDLHNSE